MCGRTALTTSPEELRRLFGLDGVPELLPHYNTPPSQPLAVVRVLRGGPGRRLDLLRWGLVPSWAKDAKIGHKLALSRLETAKGTPAFRDAIRRRRCLIVVDGFFEWKRSTNQKSRPFFVRRPDKAPFALAGMWERWVSKDGEVIESCAILTQPAKPPVDAVHDRMPLILDQPQWDAWLDPAVVDDDAITHMLEPRTPELIAYEVGARVNDPRHDDPACLDEGHTAEQRALF